MQHIAHLKSLVQCLSLPHHQKTFAFRNYAFFVHCFIPWACFCAWGRVYSQNLYVEENLEKEDLTEVGLGPGLIRWHVQYYCSMDTLHLPENHRNNNHLLRLYCKSQAFPSLVPFSPYKRQYICSYVVDGKLRRRVFMLFNITAVEHIAGSCQ